MKRMITRREREVTDINEITEILKKGKVVRVGMIDGDEPYVVPMNYGFEFANGELILYLHSALKGRKLDIIKENPKVFIEIDCDIVPFEGESACHYGVTYSSVMGLGKAEIIEDIEEKKAAMAYLMKTQTEKDFDFSEKMVSVVSVIKITVPEITAKKRPMPSHKTN